MTDQTIRGQFNLNCFLFLDSSFTKREKKEKKHVFDCPLTCAHLPNLSRRSKVTHVTPSATWRDNLIGNNVSFPLKQTSRLSASCSRSIKQKVVKTVLFFFSFLFTSSWSWSSAYYWPAVSNWGPLKRLTCRYPAGPPLEKGVGNYIAFRLIRHSCQI